MILGTTVFLSMRHIALIRDVLYGII